MGWVMYAAAWLTGTLFWTLAAATGSGRPPLDALPYAVLAMGSAAAMGVGVWHLTRRVAWDGPRLAFYGAHGTCLAAFCAIYATSSYVPDLAAGRLAAAVEAMRGSPVLLWNLLMGSWLYLVVAGVSYAVRAHDRARAQDAAIHEARLLAQQAQLAALRAQINPHFLFNALHTVGALIPEAPDRADTALECLGDLLRYALGAEDAVPLQAEWAFTMNYLAFERLRLGDRLRVVTTMEPAAAVVTVPPLILQPLVENAVRHGIADRPAGGAITVTARMDDAALILVVADDGGSADTAQGTGTGLESVRRRVHATYGPQGAVEVHRGASGFTVTLRLPAAPADREHAA